MNLATSDWHLGDGSERDRADWVDIQRLVTVACEQRVIGLFLLGDIFERAKFSLGAIIRAQTALLTAVGHDLYRAGVGVILLPGNHDAQDDPDLLGWLQKDCGWRVSAARPYIQVGRFRLEHGHRFDWACAPGPIGYLAGACTWFAGNAIERFWPSMAESWADPVGWLSPAISDPRAGAVGSAAERWAEAEGARLIMGHTHRHALKGGADWQYYNTGACTVDAPFSYVLFDEQWATLVTDRGEVDHAA